MAAAQAAENHGDVWGLTWYFQWGIYTSIPIWTHSQDSLAAAEALSLRYPPMEHLSNDHEDRPNQHESSHQAMQWSKVFCCEYDGKSKETETTTCSVFPYGGKATVEQIGASEERNKSNRAGLWESVRDTSRKVNHLSKVIWDRKIITEFTRCINSSRIGKPVLMMNVKVSKDKHISRCIDEENLIYVRWNRIKTMHKDEEGDQ